MPGSITQMESQLRELIRKWERFFSGDIRIPPLQEKNSLARRLRHLSEEPPRRSVDRFRAEQLQHRFSIYSANWERILREREEGIQRGRPLKRPAPVSVPSSSRSPENARPPSNVDQPDDLYSRWKTAKTGMGQDSGMSKEAFEKKLEFQRQQLEKKLGCRVSFDIKVEQNKVKLTARKRSAAPNGD